MKKILGLLLVLFALACSPSDHSYLIKDASGHIVKVLPVYLDEKFSADEVAAIERGIGNWNEALGDEMRLDVVDWHYKIGSANPGLLVIKISARDKAARQDDTFTALAWTTWKKDRIFLIPDRLIIRDPDGAIETPWTMQDMTEVMMHELGHSLGANHMTGGLMAPRYDKDDYVCIDLPTISQVAKYQHLELNKMKWCKR